METEADKAAAEKMRKFSDTYAASMPPDNIDGSFVRQAVLTSVTAETDTTNAKSTYTIAVPPLLSNNRVTKNMHGGAIATFSDMATSMAVLGCRNAGTDSGVTRNLNVTYLRPPVEGESILMESEVLQLTKRLVTVRGVMKRASDGTVLAICQHDKYRSGRPPPYIAKI